MKPSRQRGGPSVAELLFEEFGIEAWEWTRLKIVYEAVRMGDEYAAKLIPLVDSGELTYSGAYRMLRSRDRDVEVVGSMSSVNLQELYHKILGVDSYFATIEVALRHRLPTREGKLTTEQIEDLPALVRGASNKLKLIARSLSSPTTGGPNPDGTESQHDEAKQ